MFGMRSRWLDHAGSCQDLRRGSDQADAGIVRPRIVRNIGRVRRLESLTRGRIVQSMNGSHADHVAGGGGVPLMSDDREPATQQARDPVDEHGGAGWWKAVRGRCRARRPEH